MPVCVVCALTGCLWVWGGGCGAVCRLVLQAPAGRQWAPDTKPAGGVVGLDTPPPGQLTCRWPPHDCPHSLIALAQVVLLRAGWHPTVDWLRSWRGPGAR